MLKKLRFTTLELVVVLCLIALINGGCKSNNADGDPGLVTVPLPVAQVGEQNAIVAGFDNNDTLLNEFSLWFSMDSSSRIIRAVWDLATSRGNVYFDTCDAAPGVAANFPFTPVNGGEVGLTTSFGPCELNGANSLSLEFTNFQSGRRFVFNIDTEDNTGEIFVTGANFAGSRIIVTILANGVERTVTGVFENTGNFEAQARINTNSGSFEEIWER